MGKKTYCVVTTSSARAAATQKVRKAYKKCVPIVDVSWVEDSISSNSLLSLDSYRREADVKEVVEKKEEEVRIDEIKLRIAATTMPRLRFVEGILSYALTHHPSRRGRSG